MRFVFSYRGITRHKLFSEKYFLPVFWFVGLLSGKHMASITSSRFCSLLFSAVGLKGSLFVGILFSSAWVFAAFMAVRHRPILTLPLAFMKAWLFGFSGAGCAIAFGSAGWLIRALLLFSSYIHSVIFLLLCYTGFCLNRAIPRNLFLKFLSVSIVVELIDHFVVCRFLISLF